MRVNRLTGAGQGADAMTWQSWTNEAETVAAELLAELSPAERDRVQKALDAGGRLRLVVEMPAKPGAKPWLRLRLLDPVESNFWLIERG